MRFGSFWRGRTLRRSRTSGAAAGVTGEALEVRVLLAAVARDGGGDGVTWSAGRNWSADQLPTSADDVTVSAAPGATVQIAGTQAAHSVAATTPLRLTAGTFSIATTADVSDDFT